MGKETTLQKWGQHTSLKLPLSATENSGLFLFCGVSRAFSIFSTLKTGV
jgi:hypothetical protein